MRNSKTVVSIALATMVFIAVSPRTGLTASAPLEKLTIGSSAIAGAGRLIHERTTSPDRSRRTSPVAVSAYQASQETTSDMASAPIFRRRTLARRCSNPWPDDPIAVFGILAESNGRVIGSNLRGNILRLPRRLRSDYDRISQVQSQGVGRLLMRAVNSSLAAIVMELRLVQDAFNLASISLVSRSLRF